METLVLAEGAKITVAGIYDLPIDVYHSQCCDGPSISSSGIRRLLDSPALFWLHSELNPNRVEEKENEALILGRAAHHLLLGEKDFFKTFVVRPEELFGEKWNGNRKDCKAWLRDQKDAGKTVLTPAQIETIKGLAGVQPWQADMPNCGLKNTPIVMAGALSGDIETSLFWKHGKIWLKARPDAIPASSDDFSDLKTTTGITDRELGNSVLDRGYFVQAALVGMASSAVLKRQMKSFNLVFVDKDPPHAVAVKEIAEADIVLGERLIFMALAIFERCIATGVWPGPTALGTDAQKLSIPEYGRARLEKSLERFEQEFAL